MSIAQYLTLFILFVTPFIVLPFGTSYFEIPKVIIAQLLIELLCVVALLKQKKMNASKKALLCYGVLFLISMYGMFFQRTDTSFFGNQFRLQGIFLFWHLLAFSLVGREVFSKIRPTYVFVFLLIQAIGAVLFGVNDLGRSYGFLGEPNALAVVSVVALPLIFLKKTDRRTLILSIVMIFLLVFLSGSRSGFMAIVLESIILAALYFKKVSAKILLPLSGLIYFLFLLTPFFASNMHESRLEIWRAALLAGLGHPFLGGGIGNAEKLLHASSQMFASFISARYVDSSHNIFLDMFVQTGFIGLLAFVALITFALRSYLSKRQFSSFAMMMGLITVLSFNPGSVWTLLVFWYLIGGASESHRENSRA